MWHSHRVFVQINPSVPLVWRDHSTAQAGIDPVLVRFDDVDDATARALGELVKGTSTTRLAALLGPRKSAELQAHCGPALEPSLEPSLPRVAVIGKHPHTTLIAGVLVGVTSGIVCCDSTEGIDVSTFDVAVLVSNFVVSPIDSQPWLAHDVPHVPVVFTESGAVIGPLVRPGESACLSCVELHRLDKDAAWGAIAPQVWGRPVTVSSALATRAAACLVSVLSEPAGRVTHLSGRTFTKRVTTSSHHPRCACQSLPALLE